MYQTDACQGIFHQGQITVFKDLGGTELFSSGVESHPKGMKHFSSISQTFSAFCV